MSEFRKRLEALSREDLLELLHDQDPELSKQVRRIEWVFSNKLSHLTWDDGIPITSRPLTNKELALLIDEPFAPNEELTKLGISIEQQRQFHIASDTVLWAKHFLGATPRAFQVLMLRHPSLRKVLRCGRRMGKSWMLSVLMLHYSFTHTDGRVIVVAPMKEQVGILYKEVLKLASKSDIVNSSITRKPQSPQYSIEFSNGSSIKFFTSGVRSGGKADVVRGQEAHIIILDELDYMHNDDLESLYAMLQKTAEDQEDKIMIGASTPSGRRETFWNWAHGNVFREFWFPALCSMYWSAQMEEELRNQYTEMGYRHEIEADWGEDAQGVYLRKYVDAAFVTPAWEYRAEKTIDHSFYVMGVDWDKFGAGVNIVVLELCGLDYTNPAFQNKIRVIFREETKKEEFTYTKAINRIVELNETFQPRHIYVDRGVGECVSPETLISTSKGLKRIIDIEPHQDKVLSIDGKYHQVLGKIIRDTPKPTYRVKVAKCLPVEVSNSHPFYVLGIDGSASWKNITEIKKGEKVAVQKVARNLNQDSSLRIDILDFVDVDNWDDEWVWATNANHSQKRIKRFYDVFSSDFLKLTGWYLSEGSASGHTVEISQNMDDQFSVDEIIFLMIKIFGCEPGVYIGDDKRKDSYKKIARMCISSQPLVDFMKELFGVDCYTKHYPEFMITAPQLLGESLKTLFKGDGHNYSHEIEYISRRTGAKSFSQIKGWEIALSSFDLIEQTRLIFGYHDIPVSVYLVDSASRKNCVPMLKLYFCGNMEETDKFNELTGLDLPNRTRINRSSHDIIESHIFLPIRKIDYLGEINGLVDLQVEGGESFVGNQILLHNTQLELLHQYGIDHPETGLRQKVKGVSFSETFEMRDPASKELVKKEIKPFMVDNLSQMLEQGKILFPAHDQELYMQLISYIVVRTTVSGRPIFEASGSQVDHAHDALILACLSITQNYGKLMNQNYAVHSRAVSNESFLPILEITQDNQEKIEEQFDSHNEAPVMQKRAFTAAKSRKNPSRPIRRKIF